MTQPAPPDPGSVARVAKAGVRVELFNTVDNDDYRELQASIVTAARDATLSDKDLYPLLARYWIGRPPFDWPPDAAAVARRCAVTLAGRPGALELDGGRPSDRTRQLAEVAVIEDLQLTPRELLAVLADHWQPLARRQVPSGWQYSLLDIARQLLLEPVAGACIVLWSTLQRAAVTPAAGPAAPGLSGWDTWSIDFDDDEHVWIQVAGAELVRLGQPALRLVDRVHDSAVLLARARADLICERGDVELVSASIVRTTGWPGDRAIITPLSQRALALALGHIDDMLLRVPMGGLAEIAAVVARQLMPSDDALTEWVRDTSFARLGRLSRRQDTPEGIRRDAAQWLNWTLAHAAVNVVFQMCSSPRD